MGIGLVVVASRFLGYMLNRYKLTVYVKLLSEKSPFDLEDLLTTFKTFEQALLFDKLF